MVKRKELSVIFKLNSIFNYLSTDFLGGPRVLKFSWVINFQKAGTYVFIALLMIYFKNYSTAAWIYLGLHGSYGLCWLIKHFAFPDKAWNKKITFGGALLSFLFVLGPYWLFPYLLISDILGPDHPNPSNVMLMLCVSLHTLGVVIMIASDSQKYFLLQNRQELVENGMYKSIRHPNYLGEIMVYASYALMVGHWIPWLILIWIWGGIFLTNILMIEKSLSRYQNWEKWRNNTGMLLPLKFFK
jgi:protein-S-isoprenylcysteine O-methyltransferase Ste14